MQLRSIPLSKLYELASKEPGFALGLYDAISSELEATRDLLLTVGKRDATERAAVFLMTLSQRHVRAGKKAYLLTIPMTRSDIAMGEAALPSRVKRPPAFEISLL
jgi:CRP/FNR family transcriptional regulator